MVIKKDGSNKKDDSTEIFIVNSNSTEYYSETVNHNKEELDQVSSHLVFEASSQSSECIKKKENYNCRQNSCTNCSKYSPDNPKEKDGEKGWRRFIGLGLAFLACFSFSLAILIVKYLPQYHAFSFGVWRFIGIFLPSIPILIVERLRAKHGKTIFGTVWPLTESKKRKTFFILIFRCVCGTCAIVLQYYSLNFIDIADSTLIVFSTPCFVTLFAWLILGESCGIIPIASALLSLLGVIIVCRPPIFQGQTFDKQLLIGIALAFTAMICSTFVFIVLRKLRKVHVGLVTASFGLIGIIQCSVLCALIQRFDIPDNSWEWFLVGSVALCSFIGQTCITCALKFEQCSAISLVRSCDVIFAFVWQYIFLNVEGDVYSFVGTFIILNSVFLSGLRKWVSTMKPEHPTRKKLWFLLK